MSDIEQFFSCSEGESDFEFPPPPPPLAPELPLRKRGRRGGRKAREQREAREAREASARAAAAMAAAALRRSRERHAVEVRPPYASCGAASAATCDHPRPAARPAQAPFHPSRPVTGQAQAFHYPRYPRPVACQAQAPQPPSPVARPAQASHPVRPVARQAQASHPIRPVARQAQAPHPVRPVARQAQAPLNPRPAASPARATTDPQPAAETPTAEQEELQRLREENAELRDKYKQIAETNADNLARLNTLRDRFWELKDQMHRSRQQTAPASSRNPPHPPTSRPRVVHGHRPTPTSRNQQGGWIALTLLSPSIP